MLNGVNDGRVPDILVPKGEAKDEDHVVAQASFKGLVQDCLLVLLDLKEDTYEDGINHSHRYLFADVEIEVIFDKVPNLVRDV